MRTTVGLALRNSELLMPYKESPMRSDPITAVLISSCDMTMGLISWVLVKEFNLSYH